MKNFDLFKKLHLQKKTLYIFLSIGIIILILSNVFVNSNDKNTNNSELNNSVSKENDEIRLEKILSKVYGAGKTDVMITYDTGIEKVTIQNSKISKSSSNDTEKSGGEEITNEISEESQTVMNGSGNSQTPFIAKEVNPRVRGVLVVADGAGDDTVRYNLTNAVAAVLDVPYYRIQVLKKSN